MSIVAAVAVTGTKFPAAFSCLKKLTPGPMLLIDPPLASDASITPLSAALASVGSPSSATALLKAGVSRSATEVTVYLLES